MDSLKTNLRRMEPRIVTLPAPMTRAIIKVKTAIVLVAAAVVVVER